MASVNRQLAAFDGGKVVLTLTYDDVTLIASSLSALYSSAVGTSVIIVLRDPVTGILAFTHTFSTQGGSPWTLPVGILFSPLLGVFSSHAMSVGWGRP